MAARRQALREATQHQLQLHYGLSEPQAQHLFAHWSRALFGQLLAADAMRSLDLATALDEPLPTLEQLRRQLSQPY